MEHSVLSSRVVADNNATHEVSLHMGMMPSIGFTSSGSSFSTSQTQILPSWPHVVCDKFAASSETQQIHDQVYTNQQIAGRMPCRTSYTRGVAGHDLNVRRDLDIYYFHQKLTIVPFRCVST